MEIKPFGVNMVVKPMQATGILQADDIPLCEQGTVISIGEDVKRIQVGDVIAFSKWGAKSTEIKNEKYYFLPEDDRFILGKLTMPGQLAA